MATIFSKILSGEIPCFKIAENDDFLAFLDITPLSKGHTLVIPKIEVDYLFDMEDQHLSAMVVFAKQVAHQLRSKISCKKIGVSVIGLEVAHAHIHLIPINGITDMDFSKKMALSLDELAEIHREIIS